MTFSTARTNLQKPAARPSQMHKFVEMELLMCCLCKVLNVSGESERRCARARLRCLEELLSPCFANKKEKYGNKYGTSSAQVKKHLE